MMPAMSTPMTSTGDPFHRFGDGLVLWHFGSPVRPRVQSSLGIIAQLRFANSCLDLRSRPLADAVRRSRSLRDHGPDGPLGVGRARRQSMQRTTDAPPVAAADPGQFVSEIELPEGLSDLASSEDDRRAAESLKGYRIQGAMMRRS